MEWKRVETLSGIETSWKRLVEWKRVETLSEMETHGNVEWNGNTWKR